MLERFLSAATASGSGRSRSSSMLQRRPEYRLHLDRLLEGPGRASAPSASSSIVAYRPKVSPVPRPGVHALHHVLLDHQAPGPEIQFEAQHLEGRGHQEDVDVARARIRTTAAAPIGDAARPGVRAEVGRLARTAGLVDGRRDGELPWPRHGRPATTPSARPPPRHHDARRDGLDTDAQRLELAVRRRGEAAPVGLPSPPRYRPARPTTSASAHGQPKHRTSPVARPNIAVP